MRPGYKQTECGIIPADWEISKIGEYAFVTKLAGFEYTLHFDYSKSGPVIAVRALNIKNGTLDLTDVHTIPKETSDDLPRSKLGKGDLVISYVGTLGRVAMIPDNNRFHLAPNVAKICVDQEHVAPQFLALFLNSFVGQKLILDAAASTTQAALSMGSLRSIVFIRPPLPEQRAIAEALGDVDALLDSLDRLIAKKRHLKQAAMQQLLTGKTRLPGYSGAWDVERVGDHTDMGSGGTPSTSVPTYYDGDVPWVSISDMTKGGKIILSTERNLSRKGFANCAAQMFPAGTVLYAMYASLGECSIAGVTLSSSQAILGIRTRNRMSNEFLYYYLTFLKPTMKSLGQQGTQTNLNKSMVQNIKLHLPSFTEQSAIAAVLSDMDSELAALEARRDKTRALKQGMMQELLTGKTRLV